MGTIQTRRRKDGTTGYTASIRLKEKGVIVHSETETFDRKQHAQEWMRRREAELDKMRARGQLGSAKDTLGDLVRWYRDTIGPTAGWGRTKAADLERIQRYPIANRPAVALTSQDFVDHVMSRRVEGAAAATAGNDLVWFGQVLRSAGHSRNIPISLEPLSAARHELSARKVVVKSAWRDRRLTADEDKKLIAHFSTPDVRASIPMLDIYQFALATARRQEEITRLRWDDLEREKGIGWLNDVKHPTRKKGNRKAFRMLQGAWAIVERQPRGELVFPYDGRSIGAAFRRACKVLGIENLHFHDLRHEATSRLFERGYQIHEVAQFTLHQSWQTLRRYAQLRPEDLPER
ncbi:integrase [Luteibacter sp. 1214]|uniref:site-specific integrase n=1 Tax=Luteibacter sp. 1214 TaxID=2817735 RepID=UPI00285A3032|nr:site-specific integrase [Luteibacter sp. 1214]MDR6642747.1 integrase [Luteibacter sp. 1214]